MASFLRQIVAGPRARHAESDLDLCYVTDRIIAMSGPSQTYPQRAYRNPLDRLVAFLDSKHGGDWAIWEFRAEGTGYPDHLVHGRVRHYPWPDHHPPPFRLMPLILASMKNWLQGGDLHGENSEALEGEAAAKAAEKGQKRVVVVHCKAGKGRSGTVSCSYLVAEEGWTAEDALARFTQRRMRPQFGAGVSIPSQLRWVGYVDRWAKSGKRYVDRPIEVVEIHIWGLHHGVKLTVEGFVDEGKKIQTFHKFKKEERMVVEGGVPEGGGLSDMVWELAGYGVNPKEKVPEEAEFSEAANNEDKSAEKKSGGDSSETDKAKSHGLKHAKRRGTELIKMASTLNAGNTELDKSKSKTIASAQPATEKNNNSSTASLSSSTSSSNSSSEEPEPGGMAVIMKPAQPIRLPTSDVKISAERRSSKRKRMGLTMVTAVAHVWFNAFFEGMDDPDSDGGDQAKGELSDSGVFAIEWEAMDGIKGTSRKGARAFEKMAVVWRVAGTAQPTTPSAEAAAVPGKAAGDVPEAHAADWTGSGGGEEVKEKSLGLRVQSPDSGMETQNASIKGFEASEDTSRASKEADDGESLKGVKSSGPTGGVLYDDDSAGEDKDRGKEK